MRALLVIDMQVGCFEGEQPRLDEEAVIRRIDARGRRIQVRATDHLPKELALNIESPS